MYSSIKNKVLGALALKVFALLSCPVMDGENSSISALRTPSQPGFAGAVQKGDGH